MCRNLCQALAWADDVQIVIRPDGKQLQDLVEHLAVLGRDNSQGLESARVRLEASDQRSQFDGLGARAEDDSDL